MSDSKEVAPITGTVSNIKQVILDAASRLNQIDDERKALNEDASEIREQLRDTGVQLEPFLFARKLWNMPEEARAEYLDNLRINLSAFGIQLDLFEDHAPETLEALEAAEGEEAPVDDPGA